MEKKEKKKITWKDFGVEKILLIAIAGIILLVTNVSERRTRTDTAEKKGRRHHNKGREHNERTTRMSPRGPVQQKRGARDPRIYHRSGK